MLPAAKAAADRREKLEAWKANKEAERAQVAKAKGQGKKDWANTSVNSRGDWANTSVGSTATSSISVTRPATAGHSARCPPLARSAPTTRTPLAAKVVETTARPVETKDFRPLARRAAQQSSGASRLTASSKAAVTSRPAARTVLGVRDPKLQDRGAAKPKSVDIAAHTEAHTDDRRCVPPPSPSTPYSRRLTRPGLDSSLLAAALAEAIQQGDAASKPTQGEFNIGYSPMPKAANAEFSEACFLAGELGKENVLPGSQEKQNVVSPRRLTLSSYIPAEEYDSSDGGSPTFTPPGSPRPAPALEELLTWGWVKTNKRPSLTDWYLDGDKKRAFDT